MSFILETCTTRSAEFISSSTRSQGFWLDLIVGREGKDNRPAIVSTFGSLKGLPKPAVDSSSVSRTRETVSVVLVVGAHLHYLGKVLLRKEEKPSPAFRTYCF